MSHHLNTSKNTKASLKCCMPCIVMWALSWRIPRLHYNVVMPCTVMWALSSRTPRLHYNVVMPRIVMWALSSRTPRLIYNVVMPHIVMWALSSRTPRLIYNVVMPRIVMWALSSAMICSLHNGIHLPETEINPLKMLCGCLCGGATKTSLKYPNMQSSHPVEWICQCTSEYTSEDIQKTRYKKLVTHVELHASAGSLLESRE